VYLARPTFANTGRNTFATPAGFAALPAVTATGLIFAAGAVTGGSTASMVGAVTTELMVEAPTEVLVARGQTTYAAAARAAMSITDTTMTVALRPDERVPDTTLLMALTHPVLRRDEFIVGREHGVIETSPRNRPIPAEQGSGRFRQD